MQQDDGSEDKDLEQEEEEEEGPPAKRARTGTGRMLLDSDEVAFARSLPSIRPAPGATSQYKDFETESQDEETGEVERDELESNRGDADIDMGNGDEDDQEGLGFLDNGVCLQSLQGGYTYCLSFLDVQF